MSNSQRDTQFQGFAKLLMGELLAHFGDFEDMERIIAQRAYDLVQHVLCDHREIQWQPLESISMAEITDMTKLPDEWVVSKVEAFRKLSSPGVTFSDKQKEVAQERMEEGKSEQS